ncbi:MAG TPA: extracellular solute-binding protein [Actinophytocola sp.]|uniref:extracellular solute-binding protein n=1 Tax=Actinophytocola sp. TaxID=1872138 RepID=UPI002DDDB2E6|nr:extracellular solute-binding protein [Actinophytocola sp.]HEV2783171.1 extracellular solute-binding protein [Actinophytocola sp.]
MRNQPIDRRRFLTGTLATATLAAAGPGVLAACGNSAPTGNNAESAAVKLPTYQKFDRIKPDLPGNEQGLLDAFVRYPDPPLKVFDSPPGDGGPVSGFVLTGSPLPPAVGQNPFWQELNKRMNVDLRLTITPNADMATKFAALVAGDDLPDFIVPALFLPNGMPSGIANLPAWLESKCANLTPYLSGDAVKEYPFLANIPTDAWKECRFNGGIYGLPVHRGVGGTLMMRRDDLFAQLGANPTPATFAEFREMAKAVTNASASRWAFARPPLDFIRQTLGLPWRWKEEGGKFTSGYEMEQAKQAVADAAALNKNGVIHPDSTASNAPVKKWFNSGQAVLIEDRYTAWPQYFAENIAGPAFKIGGMRPPKYDGGGFASTWGAAPTNNFTALKKADEGRIRYLLKIANWLAAPFGSEEWLFRRFGVAGTHYVMKDGSPALTQAGASQTVLGIRYLVDAPDVIFVPGQPEASRASYEYQKSIIPTVMRDPSIGLFSDTWSRKQGQLGQIINDAQNDIIAGRKPISFWDEAVRNWKQMGGDKVKAEFEEAFQREKG